MYDKKLGWYFVEAKLQASKNHPKDSQDLRAGGIITFEENENGLNCGLFFEKYQEFLNPTNDNLFQQPKYGKAFKKDLHNKKKQNVYYYPSKVGHTLVGQMMPKVNIHIFPFID